MGQFFSQHQPHALVIGAGLESATADQRYPVLAKLPAALAEVEAYASTTAAHQAAIREALQKTGDAAAMAAALDVLGGGVRQAIGWCALADEVAAALPGLLEAFGGEARERAKRKDLSAGTDAAAALAKLLRFLLKFDGAKVGTPGIQNDVAFVKRSAQRDPAGTARVLDAAAAPSLSMFVAQASPMAARAAKEVDAEAARALAAFAAGGVVLLAQSKKPLKKALVVPCLDACTAALVLVDLAGKTPGGAFGPASGVPAAKLCAAIKKKAPPADRQRLLGVVQYATHNYAAHASNAVRGIVEP